MNKYETAIQKMEREFWEKAAAGAFDIDVNAENTAEYADDLLNEWRKRFLKKPEEQKPEEQKQPEQVGS